MALELIDGPISTQTSHSSSLGWSCASVHWTAWFDLIFLSLFRIFLVIDLFIYLKMIIVL